MELKIGKAVSVSNTWIMSLDVISNVRTKYFKSSFQKKKVSHELLMQLFSLDNL